METCKCGCGEPMPRPNRKYVNKEHQLAHMVAGEASRMNSLQPIEGKQLGGAVAGRQAEESGRLAEAGKKGAEESRAIAERFRAARSSD
jgi:hypothetical protein